MRWRIAKFGGPWPTPAQEVLLQAALGRGATAREALARWEPGFDPGRIDNETLTLLPLLYRNLASQGIASPLTAKYKSVYRWSWYRNQLLFEATRRTLAELRAAGVPTLLLKGAALSRFGYDDDGARPMGDCDVLVPAGQVHEAVRVLEAAEFTSVLPLGPGLFRSRHSAPFRDAMGRQIDLHWHVLAEDIGPGADDDFWNASQPIEWSGVPTRMLSPADHLLVVTAHGAMGGLNASPIHWIADAVVVMRRDEATLSWSRLLEQAQSRSLTLTMRHAVDYLVEVFGARVPAEVRGRLARPAALAERVEYALKVRNAARSPLGNVPRYWFAYARLCRRLGRRPRTVAFLRFVKDHRLIGTSVFVRHALLWPVRQLVWLAAALLRSVPARPPQAAAPAASGTSSDPRGRR